MTRRTFILVGVFAVTAGAAEAQPPGKVHRIGVLLHDGAPPGLLEAFREGLHELGYVEGKNVIIEQRNAAGKKERLAPLAEELPTRRTA